MHLVIYLKEILHRISRMEMGPCTGTLPMRNILGTGRMACLMDSECICGWIIKEISS